MLYKHGVQQCLLLGSVQITVKAMPSSSSSLKHFNSEEKHAELSGKMFFDLGYKQSLFINLANTSGAQIDCPEGEYSHDEVEK